MMGRFTIFGVKFQLWAVRIRSSDRSNDRIFPTITVPRKVIKRRTSGTSCSRAHTMPLEHISAVDSLYLNVQVLRIFQQHPSTITVPARLHHLTNHTTHRKKKDSAVLVLLFRAAAETKEDQQRGSTKSSHRESWVLTNTG